MTAATPEKGPLVAATTITTTTTNVNQETTMMKHKNQQTARKKQVTFSTKINSEVSAFAVHNYTKVMACGLLEQQILLEDLNHYFKFKIAVDGTEQIRYSGNLTYRNGYVLEKDYLLTVPIPLKML